MLFYIDLLKYISKSDKFKTLTQGFFTLTQKKYININFLFIFLINDKISYKIRLI